jgi:hypothetical protein
MISERGDYSSEIMALILLILLSVLSHYWYALIAICVGAVLIGIGFLFRWIVLCATVGDQTKGVT